MNTVETFFSQVLGSRYIHIPNSWYLLCSLYIEPQAPMLFLFLKRLHFTWFISNTGIIAMIFFYLNSVCISRRATILPILFGHLPLWYRYSVWTVYITFPEHIGFILCRSKVFRLYLFKNADFFPLDIFMEYTDAEILKIRILSLKTV